jgi:hypothetical protein
LSALWLAALAQPATSLAPSSSLPGGELPLSRAVPGVALIIAGLIVLILVRVMGRSSHD